MGVKVTPLERRRLMQQQHLGGGHASGMPGSRAAGGSVPGTLRLLFMALMVACGGLFFFNGAQTVLHSPRLAKATEELEACQRALKDKASSCDRGSASEDERKLLQAQLSGGQSGTTSCPVAVAALQNCRADGDKCRADLATLAAANEKLEVQKQAGAECRRREAEMERGLSSCRKVVERLENPRLRVHKGNEDVKSMQPQQMVDEIQRLRAQLASLSANQSTESKLKESLEALKQSEIEAKAENRALEEKVRVLEEGRQHLEDSLDRAQAQGIKAMGYKCRGTPGEIRQFLNYTQGAPCPDDLDLVEALVLKKECTALPRRTCRALTPLHPPEPLPLPASLFSQRALNDSSVRWGPLHRCKSFECLNQRTEGACLSCFDLSKEEKSKRWRTPFLGSIPIAEVLALKKGTLRIGLDVGGGTGSFAAHMAKEGVQIVTTTGDLENSKEGLSATPNVEAVALRGLIPLYVPTKARLPFFDGVLDLVHAANVIKYLEPSAFVELLYEWDRVLRVGGVLWLEQCSQAKGRMTGYVAAMESLGYRKLLWNEAPKTVGGEELVFLNCVLEKTPVVSPAAGGRHAKLALGTGEDEAGVESGKAGVAEGRRRAEEESGVDKASTSKEVRNASGGAEEGSESGKEARDSSEESESTAEGEEKKGSDVDEEGKVSDPKGGGDSELTIRGSDSQESEEHKASGSNGEATGSDDVERNISVVKRKGRAEEKTEALSEGAQSSEAEEDGGGARGSKRLSRSENSESSSKPRKISKREQARDESVEGDEQEGNAKAASESEEGASSESGSSGSTHRKGDGIRSAKSQSRSRSRASSGADEGAQGNSDTARAGAADNESDDLPEEKGNAGSARAEGKGAAVESESENVSKTEDESSSQDLPPHGRKRKSDSRSNGKLTLDSLETDSAAQSNDDARDNASLEEGTRRREKPAKQKPRKRGKGAARSDE